MKRKSPDRTIEAFPNITSSQPEQYTSGSPLNQTRSQQIMPLAYSRHKIRLVYAQTVAQHHYGMAL